MRLGGSTIAAPVALESIGAMMRPVPSSAKASGNCKRGRLRGLAERLRTRTWVGAETPRDLERPQTF